MTSKAMWEVDPETRSKVRIHTHGPLTNERTNEWVDGWMDRYTSLREEEKRREEEEEE